MNWPSERSGDKVPFTHLFRGWNWAFNIGDGNLNRKSNSPETMSHKSTFQSVEELSSLLPLRFQLHVCVHVCVCVYMYSQEDHLK